MKVLTIRENGTFHWKKDGKRHRDGDKPAYVSPSGHRSWSIMGRWHRDHGPSLIYSNGDKHYYKIGIFYTCKKNDRNGIAT
jgi:hypothetical protein